MQDAFAEFSKEYVLFCHVTSRVPTDSHQELLHEKGGHGFPYIVFMDAEGGVLAEPDGRTIEAYRKTGAECAELVKMKAEAEKGDPRARVSSLVGHNPT